MFLGPSLGFLVQAIDVLLELLPVYTPDASPADLDRRQLARAHEGINLGHAHTEVFRHLVQSEKSRFDLGHRRMTIAVDEVGYLNLKAFALVWRPLAGGAPAWR